MVVAFISSCVDLLFEEGFRVQMAMLSIAN